MSLRDDLIKYENSLTSLSSANNQINILRNDVIKLRDSLIQNFNIDDKGLQEDNLTSVIGELSGISNTISNGHMANLRQKITETKEEIEREEARKREEEEKKQLEEKEKAKKGNDRFKEGK